MAEDNSKQLAELSEVGSPWLADDDLLYVHRDGQLEGEKIKRDNLTGRGFDATATAGHVIPEDSSIELDLDVESYDHFNALAGTTFTVPVTGLYMVEMIVKYTNQTGRIQMTVAQGAGQVAEAFLALTPGLANPAECRLVAAARMTAGQAVKFRVGRPDDGDGSLTILGGSRVRLHRI